MTSKVNDFFKKLTPVTMLSVREGSNKIKLKTKRFDFKHKRDNIKMIQNSASLFVGLFCKYKNKCKFTHPKNVCEEYQKTLKCERDKKKTNQAKTKHKK